MSEIRATGMYATGGKTYQMEIRPDVSVFRYESMKQMVSIAAYEHGIALLEAVGCQGTPVGESGWPTCLDEIAKGIGITPCPSCRLLTEQRALLEEVRG